MAAASALGSSGTSGAGNGKGGTGGKQRGAHPVNNGGTTVHLGVDKRQHVTNKMRKGNKGG